MERVTHERINRVAPVRMRHRRRDWAAWPRYLRHLVEMVVAMAAGMMVLGVAVVALGEPPGYANLLGQYAWMGAAMSVPMVVWMRRMGHTWADGGEMTASMLVPMFALVLPVELGVAVPGLTVQSLPLVSHVAMIAGMAALMVYRWDLYTGGQHCH